MLELFSTVLDQCHTCNFIVQVYCATKRQYTTVHVAHCNTVA